MKITALQPQRRSSKRVSVFVDGEFLFGVSVDTVVAAGLRVGADVDRADIDRIALDEQRHEALNYAFLLLSYKARTTAELDRRLVRKGFPPDIIERTIERLAELKMVDDADFARRFVEDRVNVGHRGKRRIYSELLKRGVERRQIDAALDDAPDETAGAREVAAKFRRQNSRLEPAVLRRRLYGFLARRGFGPDTIRQVIGATDGDEPESGGGPVDT